MATCSKGTCKALKGRKSQSEEEPSSADKYRVPPDYTLDIDNELPEWQVNGPPSPLIEQLSLNELSQEELELEEIMLEELQLEELPPLEELLPEELSQEELQLDEELPLEELPLKEPRRPLQSRYSDSSIPPLEPTISESYIPFPLPDESIEEEPRAKPIPPPRPLSTFQPRLVPIKKRSPVRAPKKGYSMKSVSWDSSLNEDPLERMSRGHRVPLPLGGCVKEGKSFDQLSSLNKYFIEVERKNTGQRVQIPLEGCVIKEVRSWDQILPSHRRHGTPPRGYIPPPPRPLVWGHRCNDRIKEGFKIGTLITLMIACMTLNPFSPVFSLISLCLSYKATGYDTADHRKKMYKTVASICNRVSFVIVFAWSLVVVLAVLGAVAFGIAAIT